ncbi:hypothetical protein [Deinococcus misasensis]|uniref:hypothetical protein n=1 Tax=Deinococcus misasensis TaxID=392413 RepID=UPI0014700F07|nr:hypothetical protein [Deinococcus misasensis]
MLALGNSADNLFLNSSELVVSPDALQNRPGLEEDITLHPIQSTSFCFTQNVAGVRTGQHPMVIRSVESIPAPQGISFSGDQIYGESKGTK